MLVWYDKRRRAYYPFVSKRIAVSLCVILLLSYVLLWYRSVNLQRHLVRQEKLINASMLMASDLTQKVNDRHITPPVSKRIRP